MFWSKLKILWRHGYQAIPNLDEVRLPSPFRGRPLLSSKALDSKALAAVIAICPTGAIGDKPFALDMGRCLFCGQCARMLPSNIVFTQNWRTSSLTRAGLIVYADKEPVVEARAAKSFFKQSLKLRSVCAGGDGSSELELGATGNVNFDVRRMGVEFTASPRNADGVVVTGAITTAMAPALEVTFASVSQPRILIACGVDAISGGLFEHSPAIDRSFFDRHTPDLYIPGNPPHPLTFIEGIKLLRGGER